MSRSRASDHGRTFLGVTLGILGLVTGCGGSSSGGTGGTGGTVGDAGYDGPTFGVDAPGVGEAQCSNGIDDDGDGNSDYDDQECVGPLDNDESSFATGIPGDNRDECKQDCFFDGNSGAGDDGCDWQLKCDPESPGENAGCPYDQAYAQSHVNECSTATSQSQACIDYCQRLTPNGCDCFGCCDIPGVGTLLLVETCTADAFGDETKCPTCTQVTSCLNPCGTCEYCIGKTTLPPECQAPTNPGQCPSGVTACTGDAGACPANTICTGGCCIPTQCPTGVTACGDPAPPNGVVPSACPAGTGCVTGCCIPLVQ